MISERIEIESGDGRKALLSCFIKENTAGRPDAVRKAVVICPGGSYAFCSTREGEPVAFQFLAMDCQAFVLNYTAPAPFPRALCQLAEAVAYIRSRAEEWHIDPNGIFVCGFSAGGHLAEIKKHYAMIGMASVQDGYPLYAEAVNEKGLGMAGLNFTGNAVYQEEEKGKDNVTPFELIPWLLAQCASVSEVRRLLENINLLNVPFAPQIRGLGIFRKIRLAKSYDLSGFLPDSYV